MESNNIEQFCVICLKPANCTYIIFTKPEKGGKPEGKEMHFCVSHLREVEIREHIIKDYFAEMGVRAYHKAVLGYLKDKRPFAQIKLSIKDEIDGELLDYFVYNAYLNKINKK